MSENWVTDLGLIYEEWRGVTVDSTPHIRHQTRATENPKLSIGNRKLGTVVPNLAANSLAGNVPFGNTFNSEQEEEISGPARFIKEELAQLNPSNPTDRVAILALNNVLTKIMETQPEA